MKSSKLANSTQENGENFESPSTQKPQSKWLWLFLSLLILGSGSAGWLWLKQDNSSLATETQSPPAMAVKLSKLSSSNIKSSSEFVGVLDAQQRVSLRPETDGRIVKILVSSGARVTKGTPVIQLRPDKNRAQLNSAIARINSLKAALNQAESQFRAAEAEKDSDIAELQLQEEEFKRTSFLVKEGAQSKQALDRVQRDRQAALAALKAAQKRVNAARSAIDVANADLRQAEADADLEQENLQETEVIAPVSGTIGDIPVKIGDYVETTDSLTTITQNQSLELRLAIPIENSTRLRIGLPVELRTSQGGEPLVIGNISFISPRVDTASQVVLAKASFPNSQNRLKDQQFVRAKIIWSQASGVLVPASAITRLGNQAFVFVAQNSTAQESGEANQIAEQRPVKLGLIEGNYYQVTKGIEPGETLITSGIQNLYDGALITPESVNYSTDAGQ